ncbi:hypothetical protein YC2023_087776 [Brassica napus]
MLTKDTKASPSLTYPQFSGSPLLYLSSHSSFCISPHTHQCIEMFLSKWADFVLLSSVVLEESLSESMFDICITSCFLIPLVK